MKKYSKNEFNIFPKIHKILIEGQKSYFMGTICIK